MDARIDLLDGFTLVLDEGRPTGRDAVPRAVQRLVASVWQNVLGVTTVGVEDNFFDLGGHSLLMVRVRMQLREALDRDVSMIDLFRHTTVGTLARHLGEVDSTQQRLQNVRERAHKQKLAMHRRKPLQRNGETS